MNGCHSTSLSHDIHIFNVSPYERTTTQSTCRIKKWSLDKFTLYTSITDKMDASDIVDIPENGCYISGLYLEGASWDIEKKCLCRQMPKVSD